MVHVSGANPYAWPYGGNLLASDTALLVIDMQVSLAPPPPPPANSFDLA